MSDKTFNLQTRLDLNTDDFKKGVAAVQGNVKALKDGIDGATGNIGEMRKALMQLKNVSFAGKSVEEIKAINQQIGNLTDDMGDLKAMQRGMGMEFGTLMAKGLQAFGAIIEVGMGVAMMFGVSEESAKKYQAIMTNMIGIMQGLGVIQDAFETKLFKTIATRIADTAATAAQTAAQWALNASLLVVIGTIGAIIAVIGIAILVIYNLTTGYYDQAEAVDKLRQEKEKLKELDEKANKQYALAYRLMVARGEDEKVLKQYQIAQAKIEMNQIEDKFNKLNKVANLTGKLSKDEIKEKEELQNRYTELEGNVKVYGVELENLGKKAKKVNANLKPPKPSKDKINYVSGIDFILKQDKPKEQAWYARRVQLNEMITESVIRESEEQIKAEEEAAKKKIEIAKLEKEQKIDALSQTFGLAAGMFEQNTIAYKAMAIAQASIDTYKAANVALASAPPPFNFVLMGATIAAGLVNVAKIAGFEYGGIVPGSSYSGDKVPVMANSGEMILNGNQQSNLFSMINRGDGGVGKNVEFKIRGTELVGVLSNYNKKIMNTR